MGNPVVHFEVLGKDGEGLIRFYTELFGWHVEFNPQMQYGVVDTHAGGGINGGIGSSQDGAPVVTFYVAVPDLAATLAQIEARGGKTVVPPTEIPNIVTFAHFLDPQGNLLGVIKDDGQAPAQEPGNNPEVGWFEILTAGDVDALASFYAETFGWTLKRNEIPGGGIYNEADTGGAGCNGGIGNAPDGRNHVTVYAGVDDVTKTLERAEALGGTIMMPETKVTEETIIGWFADPQGNGFGVYKRMPR